MLASMPESKFALEREGPKRITIQTAGANAPFVVFFDDREVATVERAEAERIHVLSLPDGSTLELRYEKRGAWGNSYELHLLRNGAPLPGSVGDPVERAKQGGYLLFFIAALNLACGAAALLGGVDALAQAGAGVGSMIAAGLYGVLGFLTMRGSRVALGIAMALYVLDWLAGVALSLDEGGSPNLGGLFVRVIFVMAMWRSFTGMAQPSPA